jgi:hypothetical protein
LYRFPLPLPLTRYLRLLALRQFLVLDQGSWRNENIAPPHARAARHHSHHLYPGEDGARYLAVTGRRAKQPNREDVDFQTLETAVTQNLAYQTLGSHQCKAAREIFGVVLYFSTASNFTRGLRVNRTPPIRRSAPVLCIRAHLSARLPGWIKGDLAAGDW